MVVDGGGWWGMVGDGGGWWWMVAGGGGWWWGGGGMWHGGGGGQAVAAAVVILAGQRAHSHEDKVKVNQVPGDLVGRVCPHRASRAALASLGVEEIARVAVPKVLQHRSGVPGSEREI